jgi:tripartite-type tricarboxylate transporter receptor subunit TctC
MGYGQILIGRREMKRIFSLKKSKDFPTETIKILVPTGPGCEDSEARGIASHVQKHLGVKVVVENKVGFWGKTTFEAFQSTEPDGYTLISYSFPRSIILEKMCNTNYRTRDFTPVFAWSIGNQVLVIPPGAFKTFEDFIKAGKTKTLTGAIQVKGGTCHLAGLLLVNGLGINVKWANYEGSASSLAALARKEVDFTICLATALPSWIRARKISVLAMLPHRSGTYFPDIPSLQELGYDVVSVTVRHVVEAPPKTPPHIVSVLEEAFSKAVKESAYIKWAKNNNVIIDPLNARELSKVVAEAYPNVEKFREMLTGG